MRQHTHGQTAVEGPAERPGAYASCAIRDYLDKKTPKTNYAPYILSGGVVNSNGGKEIILKNIDTCVPNAPHFGVPQENV